MGSKRNSQQPAHGRALPWTALGCAVALGLIAGQSVGLAAPVRDVTITVDGAQRYQTMDGFGVSHHALAYYPDKDPMPPRLRAEAIRRVYGDVGISMGNVALGPYEMHDLVKRILLDPAAPYGFDNWYPAFDVNLRWGSPWLKDIREKDYNRYLDECGEQVAASLIHWRAAYGAYPHYLMLFNEPTSGNVQLVSESTQEVVDVIKRVGGRLRKEGFADVRFVVPGEETEERSLEVASALLADPEARRFVGAIAYHTYPYGSVYASVPRILSTSGTGKPDPSRVAIRAKLRDLGRRYGLPLWMTEVSHGEVPALSFDGVLGRAIHIHDEFIYANASAYFGMSNIWDTFASKEHFGTSDIFSEDSMIALIDEDAGKVYTTAIGYAIGHYARWIRRGDIRIAADSSDSLCQVTAFRSGDGKRATMVLINSSDEEMKVMLHLRALSAGKGVFQVEQSVADKRWERLNPVQLEGSPLALSLPAKSVTSIGTDPRNALALASGITGLASADTPVRVVHAPENCLAPDVVMDAAGVLHMVYGLEHNAYYVQSRDNGVTFTPPVKVDSEGGVTTAMGERGPKLAVGEDGVIHVVWADRWAPGVQCYVRYSRSLDNGKTFEPRKTVSSMPGVDGVTMTADGAGKVIAFWHVAQPLQGSTASATWLYVARSADNGATFGVDEQVRIADLSGLACSMCMMRARVAANGKVYLAFRSAAGNIRDFYVLEGTTTGNSFTAVRVNQDNWNIDYCPMVGPELTLTPTGRALCAFMTKNKVYWAISDPEMSSFSLHVPTPANEKDEIYPAAVANRKGEVLFVWQVGPMSTESTATVKWALYHIDGTFTGRQGEIGPSFSGTKATAFVGTDDAFYIVRTAVSEEHQDAGEGNQPMKPAADSAQWSPLAPFAGAGSIGSPGGTHPIATDGTTVHAVYAQEGRIYYRRSADGAVTWESAIPIVSSGTAQYPCSLELSGSALHLIWPDARDGTWEVYYKRSTDGGNTWGPDTRLTHGADLFRLGTAVSGSTLHIVRDNKTRIEPDPDGTHTWGEIYYVRSLDGGLTWGPEVRLTAPAASSVRPTVAAFGNYVHVAWPDRRDATRGWDWEIYYKRSTDGGVTWEPDVRVTHTPTHTRHPEIVATPGGVVCCIWEDGQVFDGARWGGDPALYSSVSADDGKTWTPPRRITTVNAPHGFATHAKVTVSGARIHLAWTDSPDGPDGPEAAYYMTSADGGLTWGEPERLTFASDGSFDAAAVGGSDSCAIVLVGPSDAISYRRRDIPAIRPSRP